AELEGDGEPFGSDLGGGLHLRPGRRLWRLVARARERRGGRGAEHFGLGGRGGAAAVGVRARRGDAPGGGRARDGGGADVGVVDVQGAVRVGGGELRGGQEEHVFALLAARPHTTGVEERGFFTGGTRADQPDTAVHGAALQFWLIHDRFRGRGRAAAAEALWLELIHILLPVGVRGHEADRAVEEQAALVGEVAGLVEGDFLVGVRPAGERARDPLVIPVLLAVREQRGLVSRRLQHPRRARTGRVTRRAHRPAGGGVVLEDLLVRHTAP